MHACIHTCTPYLFATPVVPLNTSVSKGSNFPASFPRKRSPPAVATTSAYTFALARLARIHLLAIHMNPNKATIPPQPTRSTHVLVKPSVCRNVAMMHETAAQSASMYDRRCAYVMEVDDTGLSVMCRARSMISTSAVIPGETHPARR